MRRSHFFVFEDASQFEGRGGRMVGIHGSFAWAEALSALLSPERG